VTKHKIFDEPSETSAEDGAVRVVGPDTVQVKLTAEAALETARRLQKSGLEAAQSRKKSRTQE
jgi:hypothetical protein